MTENPLHDQVVDFLMNRFYGKSLINNVYRGDYVEGLIYFALRDRRWNLLHPWAGWDLEREDGVRVEVKNSAGWQTWSHCPQYGATKNPEFSVAPKKSYYLSSDVCAKSKSADPPARSADLYIFAWHPKTDRDIADHRRAEQWQFFVIPESMVAKSRGDKEKISLNQVKELASAVTYAELAAKVTAVADGIPRGELKAHQLR